MTPRFRFSILAVALAFASAVSAQGAPATGTAGHGNHAGAHERGHGPQRMERRLSELKKELQLAPEQETAWSEFTRAMQPAAKPQRADREALAKLPTPERIDQMRALRQQHMAQMDRRADATKAFYATLTPPQQQRFDQRTARHMDGGGHHRHGHHGHHG